MQDRFRFRYFDNSNRMREISLTDCYYTNLDYSRLMQSTGLKDKNGKLIYEGDIIKIPNDYDTYEMFAGEKREIYFYDGGFRLKPKWDKNSRGNWLEDTNAFEIVSNVYENPELLENEQ